MKAIYLALSNKSKSFFFILCGLLLLPYSVIASSDLDITLTDDSEITLQRFPANGNFLIVWLAPEYGFRQSHRDFAQRLSEQGIEVWQNDLTESLFMPPGSNSIRQITGTPVADIVTQAHKQTGKNIILAGDSYAAISVLRGGHQWLQHQHNENYLAGLLLCTPFTYTNIPALGHSAELVPAVAATTLPVLIYQAQNSASNNQFEYFLSVISQNDTAIYHQPIPSIMSLFYQEPMTDNMKKAHQSLAPIIAKTLPLLASHKPKKINTSTTTNPEHETVPLDSALTKYTANNQPIPIKLLDSHHKRYEKSDFKNGVTVVNFWATWCGPCIEEIPSLNRLKNKMSDMPFELISINYAEDKATIDAFMQQVHVNFPVLLDQEGNFAKQWKVVAYPSTFVIGPDGKIKYGVNAAIEWDSPEVIQTLRDML